MYLPYLFVNTLFKGHSIGSWFIKFFYENDKLFVTMLKNLVKFSNYLSNLWINISGIKQIAYQPQIFGIRSLFVLFHLVLHSSCLTEYCSYLLLTQFIYFKTDLRVMLLLCLTVSKETTKSNQLIKSCIAEVPRVFHVPIL